MPVATLDQASKIFGTLQDTMDFVQGVATHRSHVYFFNGNSSAGTLQEISLRGRVLDRPHETGTLQELTHIGVRLIFQVYWGLIFRHIAGDRFYKLWVEEG